MQKQANSANNGERGLQFISFHSEHDGETNGVGMVKVSIIFAMQGGFSLRAAPF